MSTEKREPIVTHLVRRICTCGGEMRSSVVHPGPLDHTCAKCGRHETLARAYPFIDTESDDIYPLVPSSPEQEIDGPGP